jgi:hypothetical protein
MKKVIEEMKKNDKKRVIKPSGYYSNKIITNRNGGVRHKFIDSIGGCSSNYR